MSYILEALKKSERERARGREQDLLQVPAAPPPAPALRPGVVLGLSALLLAGGIAIGWWQPWQRPATQPRSPAAPPEDRLASAPGREPSEAATPVAPTRAEALRELRPLLPEGGGVAAPPPVRAKPSPAAAEPAAAPPRPAVQAAPPAPAPRPVAEAPPPPALPARTEANPAADAAPKVEDRKAAAKPPAPKELPPPPNRVLAYSELPQALREALPPLTIRGFVHSDDPDSRMVVVNDRMLHEGDEIAAELKLERIDPDGMVLNFRGYRFVAPR